MASTLPFGGPRPRWAVRITTLLVWALALFSAAYWILRFMGTPTGVASAPPALRSPPPANADAVARLLGGGPANTASTAAAPDLAGRFVLTGVVADRRGGGAALIAVDGRPPRPFLVGGQVTEGLIVQAVEGRRVMLGASRGGPHDLVLELPAPASP
ncbi:general secretion pathway protein C [Ramlibacter sp. AW1]|uniref:General secretion pathway protein C n=1 Tax=Ramlibacter aurantiacus TaxID=2801330 RepID=A0A936ZX66_9BURK|nr:general secretion pathway protein C [Ramlibacter aurantiacus]MBL0422745.1 general secretion pathway protein C [Ramlibacter aurantiacus]